MNVETKLKGAEADEVERFEFRFETPINVFGEMTNVLKWRKPTGADLVRIGNPVIFYPTTPVKIEHDMPKMVTMMARLTGAPTSSIERMTPEDMLAFAWTLSPFFMPRV